MLRDKLARGEFVVTMEVDPPRGGDPWKVYEKIKDIAPLVDAVNIADSPTAKLRMSPIALAHLVQRDLDIEAIFHLTCRDRNLLGLQAELLGAYGLGVNNILTLTGDNPNIGDHPQATGVFDVDSVGLAKIANQLNQGQDFLGRELDGHTEFFIGAVANPASDELERELNKINQKIENGVDFFQTQPIFNIQQLENFQHLAPKGIPFIYGIMPLKSVKQAHYLNNHVPGVHVPDEQIKRLEEEGAQAGVEMAKELIAQLKDLVHGIHIFPMGKYEIVEQLLT